MEIEKSLESEIRALLHEKKFENVLQLLKEPQKNVIITNNVWRLINVVCLTLKINNLIQNDSDISVCKKILMYLVDKGNPKEVLIALLEEADSFKDNDFFCFMLDPLQLALKKTPGKRGKTFDWVLSTLNAHIKTLPLPEDMDLQGEEKLLLDTDAAVIETNYVLKNYLHFLEPFVEEVTFEALQKKEFYHLERVSHQREILLKYILMLFHHPLLYHDLHLESSTRPKSTIRVLCEQYINDIKKICCNIFNLFKLEQNSATMLNQLEVDEDETISRLAFANVAYLIFVENMAFDFQPFVYSHKFIFMTNLKYIISLLTEKENLVLFKGLHLSQVLLERLEEFELQYDCLELEVFTNFSKVLLNVGIFCQIDVHRNMAVKLFLNYMSKCDWKSRYHLIMQILSSINHSGAEGLVIDLYKKYLHLSLNGNVCNDYFLGKNLISFLKKVFILKEGVETDILENSDRIVSSINLLRYLLLRDKQEINCTGIWNILHSISGGFLKPLETGLNLSRAHYEQAAKDAEKNKKMKKEINTTVTVNNEILPNIPPHFQKEVFDRALVTFDMIESILFRVKEIMPFELY